jgi:hypothetical protein
MHSGVNHGPNFFANQWATDLAYHTQNPTLCAHFGFRSINKYLQIYSGNILEIFSTPANVT